MINNCVAKKQCQPIGPVSILDLPKYNNSHLLLIRELS